MAKTKIKRRRPGYIFHQRKIEGSLGDIFSGNNISLLIDRRRFDKLHFAVAVDMGPLRKVPASFAARLRCRRDPVGAEYFERQAAPVRVMHGVRHQGRDHSAFRVGGQEHGLPAVSCSPLPLKASPRSTIGRATRTRQARQRPSALCGHSSEVP